jgi:diguanylate cyclase (GGDEF)-like protein/PAS domain S-box-containing protein
MAIRRYTAVCASLIVVAAALHLWWPSASSAAIVIAGIASAAAVVVGVRVYRPRRAGAWWLLAAAALVNAVARVVYDLLPGEAGSFKPWMWIVWLMHLAMLGLLAVGTMALAPSTLHGASATIDLAIIVLGAGLLAGVLIAIPYASRPGGGDLWRAARIGYVFRDVLVLAVIIHIATSVRWSRSVAWLLAGLSGLVVYDVLLRLGRLHGESLTGTAVDLLWLLFFVGIAFAALSRSMVTFDTPTAHPGEVAPMRIGLVAVAALIPSAVLLIELLQQPPWYQPLIVGAATLIVVLALARVAAVAAQLRRHLRGERVLREAVTELTTIRETAALAPMLQRLVAQLIGPGTPCQVTLVSHPRASLPGIQHTDGMALSADSPARGTTVEIPLATDRPATEHTSVRGDADGVDVADSPTTMRLVLQTGRATLDALRPRLEVLGAQAGFALERIRLNDDNTRHVSESYFRTLVRNSTDVILIVNSDDTVRYASPSAAAVFGSRPLIGAAIVDLISAVDRPAARRLLEDTRNHGAEADTDISALGRAVGGADWSIDAVSGPPTRVEVNCRDLRDDSSIRGLVLTLHNVTQQRALERELEYRAFHDPLTGLANRVPFTKRLHELTDGAVERRRLTAVLYADIDDLKLVNDALGHDAGDAVLSAVGDRLREFVAEYDAPQHCLAARLSGDEFAVQIDDIGDRRRAGESARRLVEILGQPIRIGGQEVTCSASVGVATTADAATGADLLRNADLALYAVKRIGKGQWRYYQPSMRSAVMARLEVRTRLERAIDDDALALYYQPIVSLPGGHPVGYEALLRWRHPTRGLLTPGDFIDVAEESGLIIPIGDWVMSTAIDTAKASGTGIADPPYVSVNVSARQFRNPGFTSTVERLLSRAGLRPQRLALEITESLLLRDDHGVWQELNDLRSLGVRVAIDDFGTGYSALSYLRDVPLDAIKLDRSFTQSMTNSPQQRDLVHGIVGLADVVGLDVVAEGIETELERDVAAAVGCRFGQGFLFGPPLPAPDILGWADPAQRAFNSPTSE